MFLPSKKELKNVLLGPINNTYIIYGWSQSYFTRKLEAALIFYRASYELKRISPENQAEIRTRSGTHQIPVLHTPENWMLADTTPLIELLDARYPHRALFPNDVMGVVVQILEDYFDEWIARTSVHWRWAYPENHALLSMDATNGDELAAEALRDWGVRVCRATGVDSDIQRTAAEKEYLRLMCAMESQLSKTAYLLGGRPTAVDCIVLGGLRAHFNHDPAPRRVIHNTYPVTINWCEEKAELWQGEGALCTLKDPTDFVKAVLHEIITTYKPFVLANKTALQHNQKAFVINTYGEDVSYLARPYVEQSRQMIKERIDQRLSSQDKCLIVNWLQENELAELYV